MNKLKKDRWGRDEFQEIVTGKIDTRGLYLAMGLLLVCAALSSSGIHWAATETQMIGIFFILIIHQVIEQTLNSTDSFFLKMSYIGKSLWTIFFMIIGISFSYNFFEGGYFQTGIFTFSGMINLMLGVVFVLYAVLICFMMIKEKMKNNE